MNLTPKRLLKEIEKIISKYPNIASCYTDTSDGDLQLEITLDYGLTEEYVQVSVMGEGRQFK